MVFFQFVSQDAFVKLFTTCINPSRALIPTLLKSHGICIRKFIFFLCIDTPYILQFLMAMIHVTPSHDVLKICKRLNTVHFNVKKRLSS